MLRVQRWFGATLSHQPSLRATSVVYDVRRPTHDGAGAGVTQRHRYAARWLAGVEADQPLEDIVAGTAWGAAHSQ